MKYIKLFESRTTWNKALRKEVLTIKKGGTNQNGVYWKVRTDSPYYDISLDKIEMPEDIKIDYLDSDIRRRYFTSSPFVFISKKQPSNVKSFASGGSEDEWSWSLFESPLVKQKLKSLREVQITKEDLDEWNFRNTVNNYNL